MSKEPVTVNGLKKLSEELIFLKEKKRPEIVNSISEARSHGDLKENAEYHAAKEQQALIESRVIAINDLIARANVLDVTKIEVGMMRLFIEDNIDIQKQLQDIALSAKLALTDKPIELQVNISSNLPHIVGDRRRIQQA